MDHIAYIKGIRAEKESYVDSDNEVEIIEDGIVELSPRSGRPIKHSFSGLNTDFNGRDFKWTHFAIKALLKMRLQKDKEFDTPNCSKKRLWQSIANELNKMVRNKMSGGDCSNKYRNLLQTYRENKKRFIDYGPNASIKWDYFCEMDKVLGEKKMYSDRKMLNRNSRYSMSSSQEVIFPQGTHENSNRTNSPNIVEMFVDQATSDFLQGMTDNDEEPTDDSNFLDNTQEEQQNLDQTNSEWSFYIKEKLKNENTRQQFRERMWEEKKELKEKEINAIMQLANAINGRNSNKLLVNSKTLQSCIIKK